MLDQVGPQALRSKIGCDPTGEPFNSVVALELHKGRPLKPFVNAGAMATVSLVEADSAQARWDQTQATYNAFSGRELTVNDAVYQSEASSHQHNRGIAWLLQSYGYMYAEPMEVCAVYTRQCSVSITCHDLVTMGAALANADVIADLQTKNVALLRADWTRRDPAITAALAALGRSGVPVYVFYRPGKPPVVLTEVLSVDEVRATIAQL